MSNDGVQISRLTKGEYERDQKAIWDKINRFEAILDGTPGSQTPGLRERVSTFITQFEAVEEERHRENQGKLAEISRKMGQRSAWIGVAGVSVAFMALVISIVGIMVGIWLHTHAGINPVQLFHDSMTPALSWSRKFPQDVTLPAVYDFTR